MIVLGQLSVQLVSCCPAHIVLFHDCICAEMLEQINDWLIVQQFFSQSEAISP